MNYSLGRYLTAAMILVSCGLLSSCARVNGQLTAEQELEKIVKEANEEVRTIGEAKEKEITTKKSPGIRRGFFFILIFSSTTSSR